MAQETHSGTSIPVSGILVVLLAVAGLAAHQFNAESSRPQPAESKPGQQSVAKQDVDARLWQDPLATVAQYRKQEGDEVKRREELRNSLHQENKQARDLPPGILP